MSKGFFQKRERLPEDVIKGSNESFIRTRYSPAKDSVTTVAGVDKQENVRYVKRTETSTEETLLFSGFLRCDSSFEALYFIKQFIPFFLIQLPELGDFLFFR